jgi:gluconolactonase
MQKSHLNKDRAKAQKLRKSATKQKNKIFIIHHSSFIIHHSSFIIHHQNSPFIMKNCLILLILLANTSIFSQTPTEKYPIDSASIEQKGVPKGEIFKFTFENSKIFPGTWREVSVYVPTQYSADKPACVYVNQDGIQWKAPTVFDNLIHKKELPVTIGVFITPGRVRSQDTASALDRFNRSFEYDGLGDNYARFILEEILPEVEKRKTSDGRALVLSKNGNDRAIGGSSSGAVCAFTAAWERPDAFSRVFSAIGTYVSLRGADRYPALIRKYEPKPLRIFLQDGSNDLNIYAGDWWKANETMERALQFSGYPKPVGKSATKNPFLNDILVENADWELLGEGYTFTEGVVANQAGEVFFQDIPKGKTYKIGLDDKVTLINDDSKCASGTSFSSDGRMITITSGWGCTTRQVISYDAQLKPTILADSLGGNDILIAKNGNIYLTQPDGREKPSKLYLLKPNGERMVVDEGIKFANGLCLSPDQTQLYVTESTSHWVWVYQIKADGTLGYKQR